MIKYNVNSPQFKSMSPAELIRETVSIDIKGTITNDSANKFRDSIQKAMLTKQPYIPIYINSHGGSLYAMAAIISLMESCGLPVYTIITGHAMSAGLFISSFGKVGCRYVSPNARILLHDASGMGYGKVKDVKAIAENLEETSKYWLSKMSEYCGHGPEFFSELVEKEGDEIYMSAERVVELGMADKVGVPTFETVIDCKVKVKNNAV